jgi:hypothetical protein
MSTALQTIQEKAQQLSPQQQAEVVEFINSILNREAPKPRTKMKLDWAGCLKDLRDQYTSVELQKEVNRWREADETTD